MFVNSITTREKKYLNKTSDNPFQIRVGGYESDERSPFSHRETPKQPEHVSLSGIVVVRK